MDTVLWLGCFSLSGMQDHHLDEVVKLRDFDLYRGFITSS